MTDTSDSFDWFDNECVVVPEQEALAVYPNPDGDVVIRREARWDENEDPFFVLLEDDAMVTRLAVETDMLLQPTSDDAGRQDTRLVISVTLTPYQIIYGNLGI